MHFLNKRNYTIQRDDVHFILTQTKTTQIASLTFAEIAITTTLSLLIYLVIFDMATRSLANLVAFAHFDIKRIGDIVYLYRELQTPFIRVEIV